MSDDLVQWLRAQLDADEAKWRALDYAGGPESVWIDDEHDCVGLEMPGGQKAFRRYWYRSDTLDWGWGVADDAVEVYSKAMRAERLREVEAKRRILDEHEPVKATTERRWGSDLSCVICDNGFPDYPCNTVRLLALPYADRPGYREEWRP